MGERSYERPRPEDLDAGDLRIAVVVSRFNLDISKRLLRGALQALEQHGSQDPDVVWVPGAVEIPLAALTLAESGAIDAIVALGCVIESPQVFRRLGGSDLRDRVRLALTMVVEAVDPCRTSGATRREVPTRRTDRRSCRTGQPIQGQKRGR